MTRYSIHLRALPAWRQRYRGIGPYEQDDRQREVRSAGWYDHCACSTCYVVSQCFYPEDLVNKATKSLLTPFRLDLCLKLAESQLSGKGVVS